MVMILSGLLKHVRGGLDLKRFDHILITVGGGTGTKKNRVPYGFCEKPPSFHLDRLANSWGPKIVKNVKNEDGFSQKGVGPRFFFVPVPPPTLIKK